MISANFEFHVLVSQYNIFGTEDCSDSDNYEGDEKDEINVQ